MTNCKVFQNLSQFLWSYWVHILFLVFSTNPLDLLSPVPSMRFLNRNLSFFNIFLTNSITSGCSSLCQGPSKHTLNSKKRHEIKLKKTTHQIFEVEKALTLHPLPSSSNEKSMSSIYLKILNEGPQTYTLV